MNSRRSNQTIFGLTLALALVLPAAAQTRVPANDFSVTLQREPCLGECPYYKVTILANGSVQYEGGGYVKVEGVRKSAISLSAVQQLEQKLRDQNFLHWEEKQEICVDYPVVEITATIDGQHTHVLEGCRTPGKILELADEIDRLAGTARWVGATR